MNEMLKKLIFSFALVGILLGSFKGYTVYAQDDSGSEVTTETTTEATTGATTESTQTTPSTKDPNSSETTSEVVASNDNKYKVKISIALAPLVHLTTGAIYARLDHLRKKLRKIL